MIKDLGLEVVWVALLRATSVLLLFLMNLLLARHLSVQEFGLFSFAFTMASACALFASLGFPIALMRLVPPALDVQNYPVVRGLLIKSYQITLLCSLLLALLMIPIAMFMFSGETSQGLLYAAMLLPSLSLLVLHGGAFRSIHYIRESVFWGQLLLLLLMVLALEWVSINHIDTAVYVYVGFASLIALIGLFRLIYIVPNQVLASQSEYKTRTWLHLTLPMAVVAGFQFLIERVDVVLLGFLSDMQTVGIYHAASRIAVLISFILVTINFIFAPRLSSAFHAGDMQRFAALIQASIRWSSAAALPLLLAILIWPEYLLKLFGSDFVTGTTILQILALGQFVNALTGATGIALVMIDRQRLVAMGLLVAVSLQIILSVLVFPYYGASGIALVTVAVSAALNVSWYATIKQIMNRSVEQRLTA
ncbi:MAG: oligosaccharide flippase family protein [Mariprofundaceae bacterium]|nr:oligosaccharide flippase family protein [Mariprofundaceae bacterium]